MKPPLIKGGQGRTRKNIEDSASTLTWLLVIFVVLILVLWTTNTLKEPT